MSCPNTAGCISKSLLESCLEQPRKLSNNSISACSHCSFCAWLQHSKEMPAVLLLLCRPQGFCIRTLFPYSYSTGHSTHPHAMQATTAQLLYKLRYQDWHSRQRCGEPIRRCTPVLPDMLSVKQDRLSLLLDTLPDGRFE